MKPQAARVRFFVLTLLLGLTWLSSAPAGGAARSGRGRACPNRRARSVGLRRALMLGAGGLVLFVYGYVVNTAPWNFGRLIGVYIVFFFLVAQGIAWAVFGQAPSRQVLLGGLLILIGSVVISTDTN